MTGLIVTHVWRPTSRGILPCAFMNCRRPPAEHERAVSGVGGMKREMRPGITPQPRGSR